jgi:isopentenyl-diphosphate Delta-isomerase
VLEAVPARRRSRSTCHWIGLGEERGRFIPSKKVMWLPPRIVATDLSYMVIVSILAGRHYLARVHSFSVLSAAGSKAALAVGSSSSSARTHTTAGRGARTYQGGSFVGVARTSSTAFARSSESGKMEEYGKGLDQNDLMESDMLVAVDEQDRIIPGFQLSKKQGHCFTEKTPRAVLHRAFSFFLFNDKNELLLTQRAASKITFPDVWTNTVCSHPLSGMKVPEDDDGITAYPDFPGIKRAAVRKCAHELGLTGLRADQIQFITRFHYWAADTVTYDANDCPWGEHEIDYILFYRIDAAALPVSKNDDEVNGYEFVSMDELKKRMYGDNDLLWSPWFVGIMERGGWDWWQNIDAALDGKFTNREITFFDPPPHHVAHYNRPEHTRTTGVLQVDGEESSRISS